MKNILTYTAMLLFCMMITACGNQNKMNVEESSSTETAIQDTEKVTQDVGTTSQDTVAQQEGADKTMTNKINIQIGDTILTATLEDNEAANELKKIIAEEGLTIQFSMYGGFEQVGSIGSSFSAHDVQTSTSAGDIMLYSGNQMVIFYGEHAWAYTRLGKIDAETEELENILGNSDVTAVFTLAE